jgi:hypothetical protein
LVRISANCSLPYPFFQSSSLPPCTLFFISFLSIHSLSSSPFSKPLDILCFSFHSLYPPFSLASSLSPLSIFSVFFNLILHISVNSFSPLFPLHLNSSSHTLSPFFHIRRTENTLAVFLPPYLITRLPNLSVSLLSFSSIRLLLSPYPIFVISFILLLSNSPSHL